MALTTIYDKTTIGRLEIKDRSGHLNVIQRRILILVDGRRTAEKILRISKVVDYDKVLHDLEEMGFVEVASDSGKTVRPRPQEQPFVSEALASPARESNEAKTLMLANLQSYSSPVKTADLVREINQAQNNAELKLLLDSWYEAISENPYAAPIVDDLRSSLVEKLL